MVNIWLFYGLWWLIIIWLVVEPYPSEKYAKASWDDDIPNWMERKMFQTTLQNIPLNDSPYHSTNWWLAGNMDSTKHQ